jgi:hypothetical protein
MRDEIRQQNQEERDRYESANLGGFRRCFPSEDPTLQEKYDELLVQSLQVCNEQNGTRPVHPPALGVGARTNIPLMNKAKALDLQPQQS